MWFIIIIILVPQRTASKQPLRIYGGIDAKPDEYPYVVRLEVQRHLRKKNNSISYKHEHLCTASALSPVWVLSAAHCIDNLGVFYHGPPYSVEKLVIRHGHVKHLPGIHDSFSDVLITFVHPMYTGLLYPIDIVRHDIGLLKTNPMNIKSYVKLSAVDYKCIYGHEAVLAGFGITTKILSNGKTETDNTLKLKMPLQVLKVLITKCDELVDLCLASRCDHQSNICGGDSGGPLLHPSGVIGVISRGPLSGHCLDSHEMESEHILGIVTPVISYIEWIYKIIRS